MSQDDGAAGTARSPEAARPRERSPEADAVQGAGDETRRDAEDGRDAAGLARLRRITLWAIGIALAVFAYFVAADRTTPFAGDARVQAFVLRVTPELSGRVEEVAVSDNQVVEAGGLLFRIDPAPFRIAVEQAEARLARAGQAVGASTAGIRVAQARLEEARAAEANVRAQSARILDLVRRGVYAEAKADEARAAIDRARAGVESAEADLRRALEELGPAGEDNPQIREATAALERARLDLSRTTLRAPSRGVVTNLQLAVGQVVSPGQTAMTFISGEEVWLLAPMRENSLGALAPGQKAEVVLDIRPGEVFEARVSTLGWGLAGERIDPATGLPRSGGEAGWLLDPQRFPVQLIFEGDAPPPGARYGSRAAVIVYSGDSAVMNAIAWARIRMIALLTYVS
jgi:multidrug resistance efflux pump